ncbi:P-loop containing nucleoside triphosphate hydrolase protein [Aspergillus crustosus]
MTEETTPSTVADLSSAPRKDIKCVVIGDNNIGKTTLLIRYTTNILCAPNELPCVFDNFTTQVGPNQTLSLFDTHIPEEASGRLKPLIYANTDVLLLCFSVVRGNTSIDNIAHKWLDEMEYYCPGKPFILVGLQTDLRDAAASDSARRIEEGYGVTMLRHENATTTEGGQKIARECRAAGYVECSSVTGVGVREVFEEAVAVFQRPVPELRRKKSRCVIA